MSGSVNRLFKRHVARFDVYFAAVCENPKQLEYVFFVGKSMVGTPDTWRAFACCQKAWVDYCQLCDISLSKTKLKALAMRYTRMKASRW